MIIGDDWFTKSMITNIIHKNEKLRTQLAESSLENNIEFAEILNQLLTKKMEDTISHDSTLYTAINSFTPNQPTSNISTHSSESLKFNSVQADKLNQVLEGKLKDKGQAFVRAGQQYNVNPSLLAAISQHETGNGKSKAAIEKNNVAGMMGVNGLKSYSSVEDSINDMARNLSKNYLGLGLTSIGTIGAKYAPVGAKNDPTGLNNHWVTGVTKYFDRLRV